MGCFRAAVFAALFLFGLVGPAVAQDVTLTSPDGAVEVSGTLLGFDGEFYRVETRFGELTVDGSGVICDGPGCPNLAQFIAEITFSGSSSMAEVLLPGLVEGFALSAGLKTQRSELDAAHFQYDLLQPETMAAVGRFVFRTTTSDEGFADLLANEADVVMSLREIRPEERKRAYEAGLGDMTGKNRSRILALDAMVAVVSPENPVQRISTTQLARIFAGDLTNWLDLGGPDAPIALHLPVSGSGLAQAVEDRLLRPGGMELSSDVIRHDRATTIVDSVMSDPFSIGMTSFAETDDARVLILTGGCGFALSASRRTIKTEDYPLTSPMFLYLPARRLPKLARDFLTFASSPAAQVVIRRAGFVDQTPEYIPMNIQGDRLANAIINAGPEVPLSELQRLIELLNPMQRLTISFRFETGSTRPDAQSRSNIEQLAQAIAAGNFDTRRLVFVGFSDGEGPSSGNSRISLSRAQAVRDAVTETAEALGATQFQTEVAAFGEALPMACDDSAWGRKTNRRVEVWVQ
jgi:phosphate transport system substrate-binding protein